MSFFNLSGKINLGSVEPLTPSLGAAALPWDGVGPIPAEEVIPDQSTEDNYFDLGKFESLLERLEGSKKRQQRQKSVEGRRDIFAEGYASMMSNF